MRPEPITFRSSGKWSNQITRSDSSFNKKNYDSVASLILTKVSQTLVKIRRTSHQVIYRQIVYLLSSSSLSLLLSVPLKSGSDQIGRSVTPRSANKWFERLLCTFVCCLYLGSKCPIMCCVCPLLGTWLWLEGKDRLKSRPYHFNEFYLK